MNRALKFTDLTPLLIISKKNWKSELIEKELKKIEKEIGKITYAIADHGSDLKKGLRLSNIQHIHDITHKIALMLEKTYKKDEEFIRLTKLMSQMRVKYYQTALAHLIPPKQRKKARYHNIKTIADWGINLLKYIKKIKKDKETYEKLKWIKEYENFIKELSIISNQINKIEKIVKTKGLTKKTAKKCIKLTKNIYKEKERTAIIHNELKEYFEEIFQLLPNQKKILITSDIIESSFGKYKNYLSSNYMVGITDLVLVISAFTSNLTEEENKEALENTKMSDLKKWKEENIGETLLKKRKEAFA